MREKYCAFSIFICTFVTALFLGFYMLTTTQVFADNGYKGNDGNKEWQKKQDKEYRKHQKEMERESRKHRKEIEREDLKHYKEQDRESRKHRKEMERENNNHYKDESRRNYKNRPNYHSYRGYRDRPYDKNRHYMKDEYKGRQYAYHGHWRSYEEWDRYAKGHPDIYKNGSYFRQSAHLMFRFCEPNTGNCFFFSIGR